MKEFKHEELMDRIVEEYASQCHNNPMCQGCPYEEFEDCLVAFAIDYLKNNE